MITHVVIFWTDKPHGEAKERLLEGVEKLLKTIPDVQNFRYGSPIASPRGAVDDSFSVAISMDFENQAMADAYQENPQHVQFLEDYFKPYSKRFVVYDFAI